MMSFVLPARLPGVRGKGGRLLVSDDAVRAYLAEEDTQEPAQAAEARPTRRPGPRRSAALADLTETIREATDRAEELRAQLAKAQERAARAEGALGAVREERDRLLCELAEERLPWWRRLRW